MKKATPFTIYLHRKNVTKKEVIVVPWGTPCVYFFVMAINNYLNNIFCMTL